MVFSSSNTIAQDLILAWVKRGLPGAVPGAPPCAVGTATVFRSRGNGVRRLALRALLQDSGHHIVFGIRAEESQFSCRVASCRRAGQRRSRDRILADEVGDHHSRPSGGGARLLHVLGHDVHRPAELLGRAELDHLGSGVEDRRVPRPDVISVAGLEDLLGAPRAERDLPLDHIAHVLALTLVIWQPREERGQVRVLGVRLEAHGPPAVEVLEVTLVTLNGLMLAGRRFRCLRHTSPPPIVSRPLSPIPCRSASAWDIDLDEDQVILFGDEMGIDDIVWMGRQKTLEEKSLDAGLTKVLPLAQLDTYLKQCQDKKRQVHFLPPYRSENKIKLASWLNLHVDQLKEKASLSFIKAVVAQRSIKSVEEIEELDRAAAISADIHLMVMQQAKPGMYERELAAKIQGAALASGGNLAYPVILTVRGEILHNHYHGNQLQDGQAHQQTVILQDYI